MDYAVIAAVSAVALAYGLVWAVWRRTYGGGDAWLLRVAGWAPLLWKMEDGQKKVRRGPWLAIGAVLTAPGWLILPPWQAAVASAIMVGHWPDGHRYDKPWYLLGRYSYAPLSLGLFLAAGPMLAATLAGFIGSPMLVWWPSPWVACLALVGALTALGYAKARMEKPRPRGPFLDGWSSWGELFAGFALGSMVAVALSGG